MIIIITLIIIIIIISSISSSIIIITIIIIIVVFVADGPSRPRTRGAPQDSERVCVVYVVDYTNVTKSYNIGMKV